jgi:nucleotide-binding universal stress UspA family protein
MYRKLLIANDGSAGAQAALTVAIFLAKRFRARLHMLSVEELPRFPTTREGVAAALAVLAVSVCCRGCALPANHWAWGEMGNF